MNRILDEGNALKALSLTRDASVMLSAPYLITLSALASTFGGIVRPIFLAALRFITRSNFMGRSTGSSAGVAPLKILST